ncbi:MAG: transposase [Planctomycetota bacterium]
MSEDLQLAGRAPYVHRVAISDSRIAACDESSVTFLYKPSRAKTCRRRTVNGMEFVRDFLQHTLPPGFQKIRYYGWMSAKSRIPLEEVRWLIWLFLGWTFWLARSRASGQAIEKSASAMCELWQHDASGRDHLRADGPTKRARPELPRQWISVITINPIEKVETSSGGRPTNLRADLKICGLFPLNHSSKCPCQQRRPSPPAASPI